MIVCTMCSVYIINIYFYWEYLKLEIFNYLNKCYKCSVYNNYTGIVNYKY